MRNVDFNMLMNFAYFVYIHDNQYKPQQLEDEATKAGLFSKGDKTFGHTTKFNYRKILEHLGFLSIVDGRYAYSKKTEFIDFIKSFNAAGGFNDKTISFVGKQIVENIDCRKNFFDLFTDNKDYSYEDLGNHGGYLLAKPIQHEFVTRKGKTIVGICLSSSQTQKNEMLLDTADKIQAIFWGIRKWSYDFQITDEFFYSSAEGRIIYPISKNNQHEVFFAFLLEIIRKNNSMNDWISLHIPSIIKNYILHTKNRPNIENIKKMIISFVEENKRNVIYIPTSVSVIEAKIPVVSQVQEYMKCFIHIGNIGYISHLKINKKGLCHE